MKRVRIAELKDKLSKHLRAVERGEEVEVTDRDRPIARIVPVPGERPMRVRPASRPFTEVRDREHPTVDWPVDVVDLLREERGDR